MSLHTEDEAIQKIKAEVTKTYSDLDVFVDKRKRARAGEYTLMVVARVAKPESQKSEELTKALMKLFIEGDEIVFKESYLAVLAEKNIRVEDFVLEATISLI